MRTARQTGSSEALAAWAPRPRAGWLMILAWLIGTAILGFVIWFGYWLSALGNGCPNSFGPRFYAGGGQLSRGSLLAAALLGGALWLTVGVAALGLRRRLGLLFGAYVGLFVVGLVVLWYVSPLIWGPRYC